MSKAEVILVRLEVSDRNQFILDNQEAFRYGATEEFGLRDNHFEEDGEIISRETIEHAIDEENAEAYRIVSDGQKVGGVVILVDKEKLHGDLDLLFVSPHTTSREPPSDMNLESFLSHFRGFRVFSQPTTFFAPKHVCLQEI